MAEKNTVSGTPASDAAAPSETPATVERVIAVEQVSSKDLADLQELTTSLLQAVGTLQAQSARGLEFRGLIEDVKAATRSLALAPANAAGPGVGERVNPNATVSADCQDHGGCGCGPCACLSPKCCLFEVAMTHVRVTEMQIEPFDSNALPFSEMEVRLFASIDGIGAIVPNSWSTISLRKNIGKPGVWVSVGRKIGTVMVCKGQSKVFNIDVEGVEVDDGGVEAAGVRDEYGTGSSPMVLDCCVSIPFHATVDVQLDHGGLGGGAIEVKFEARKICC